MPSESMTMSSMVAYERLSPLLSSSKLIGCCCYDGVKMTLLINQLQNSAKWSNWFSLSKPLFFGRCWIWDLIWFGFCQRQPLNRAKIWPCWPWMAILWLLFQKRLWVTSTNHFAASASVVASWLVTVRCSGLPSGSKTLTFKSLLAREIRNSVATHNICEIETFTNSAKEVIKFRLNLCYCHQKNREHKNGKINVLKWCNLKEKPRVTNTCKTQKNLSKRHELEACYCAHHF